MGFVDLIKKPGVFKKRTKEEIKWKIKKH